MTISLPGAGAGVAGSQAAVLKPRTASATDAEGSADVEAAKRAQAARQFEGVLLSQLMKVMRKSAPMLEGGQGRLYMQMFDGAIADEMAKGGGIGLAPVIERALGGDPSGPSGSGPSQSWAAIQGAQRYGATAGEAAPVALSGAAGTGRVRKLQDVAGRLVSGGASRWSKAGELLPEDLASDFATEGAHFNVMDAAGYRGHPKCNLFAFEVARRAGFQVPLVARKAGWGYPSAEAVTKQAADGRLDAGWASVVTGASSESLAAGTESGRSAIMLTGEGSGGRSGHMAIVERIHEVDYDEQGRVRQVVFDGWEARTGGAQYLTRRTWNRIGVRGGNLARTGFGRIEVLELSPSAPGERPERPLSESAPASLRDNSRSRDLKTDPIQRSEDAS